MPAQYYEKSLPSWYVSLWSDRQGASWMNVDHEMSRCKDVHYVCNVFKENDNVNIQDKLVTREDIPDNKNSIHQETSAYINSIFNEPDVNAPKKDREIILDMINKQRKSTSLHMQTSGGKNNDICMSTLCENDNAGNKLSVSRSKVVEMTDSVIPHSLSQKNVGKMTNNLLAKQSESTEDYRTGSCVRSRTHVPTKPTEVKGAQETYPKCSQSQPARSGDKLNICNWNINGLTVDKLDDDILGSFLHKFDLILF